MPTLCDGNRINERLQPGSSQYVELNTVVSVNGSSVTLAYPASKKYYQDQNGNPFGMVKLPPTPHDIALEHMSINTYNPIIGSGQSFGLTMNDLHLNGYVSSGPFGGGYRRGLLIENSVWGTGTGDLKDPDYGVVDEYDKFTDVTFLGNSIYGFSTIGAEGPSRQAQIRATEGSSQFTFKNNTFYDLSVYFDQTSDDVVTGNTFNNGLLELGVAYSESFFSAGYISYGPTNSLNPSLPSADVENNTFMLDSTFTPPYIIEVGNFASAIINGNHITYTGSVKTDPIRVYSGSVTKNTLNFSEPLFNAAIILAPDEAPGGQPSVLNSEDNIVTAPQLYSGTYITNSQVTEPITVCGNTYHTTSGGQTAFDAGVDLVNLDPNVTVIPSCQ